MRGERQPFLAAVFLLAVQVRCQLQGVDHGLGLVEADGVRGNGVQDGGEGLLDAFMAVDVWECFEVEVWVACGWFAGSRLAAGVVEVAVVLTSERRASALVTVRHNAMAIGNHSFPPVVAYPWGWEGG